MTEFSVVVHTYNRGPILSETLEAIRRQHLAASEVIVVDDGSTDDTETYVKRNFPDFIYARIENSGCGAARKTGADLARKEWIAFCDDDDLWLPDHLRRRAALIRRFPEAGFTFSNFRAFGPAARKDYIHFDCVPLAWWKVAAEIADDECMLIDKHAFRHFLSFNPAYPLTWAVKREVYRYVGGINPRYSRWQGEDSDFFRRCTLETRIACDRRVTAMYRRHDGNMSGKQVGNLLGPAEILWEQLDKKIIPQQYHEETIRYIIDQRRKAYLTAWWDRDFVMMNDIFKKYPEVRGDSRCAVRQLFANALQLSARLRGSAVKRTR